MRLGIVVVVCANAVLDVGNVRAGISQLHFSAARARAAVFALWREG